LAFFVGDYPYLMPKKDEKWNLVLLLPTVADGRRSGLEVISPGINLVIEAIKQRGYSIQN
jgi:hypothetical protein